MDNPVRKAVAEQFRSGGDPYLLPGTAVLRNVPGITDADELRRFEADATGIALVQILQRPVDGDFSLDHLCRIHKAIFGSIYPFAGRVRTVELSKDGDVFAQRHLIPREFSRIAAALRQTIAHVGLSHVAPNGIKAQLVDLFGQVNYLHPFREGNGRAQEVYFSHAARRCNLDLNWTSVTAADLNGACRASDAGDRSALQGLFERALSG